MGVFYDKVYQLSGGEIVTDRGRRIAQALAMLSLLLLILAAICSPMTRPVQVDLVTPTVVIAPTDTPTPLPTVTPRLAGPPVPHYTATIMSFMITPTPKLSVASTNTSMTTSPSPSLEPIPNRLPSMGN